MPIREYQAQAAERSCDYCRQAYEQLEALRAPPAQHCPRCGAPVMRLISVPQVGSSAAGLDDRARQAGFHK